MTQPIRLMLVDDHAQARQAMREIIETDPVFDIICEATNGEEAVSLAAYWMPDLILMDIKMPKLDGLGATKIIKEQFPYVKIVMVTVSDDITHLFEALKRGAQGYLLKNLNPISWHEYLRAVAIDEAPMSREIALRLLKEFSTGKYDDSDNSPLTHREKEILECVAKGNSNRDIASSLAISEHTVKNHLKNILHKLHLGNRVQLMRYAYDKGWIKDKG
ncbi:response regulator [Paenibacillus agricola]|uniref:Response regulator transcription factor n=1 Tax=Paenibacillus agricola TaxID=2716264 RepID=A0ABX0J2D7_9BACL|nr:response regulator transcription factor [Paenibacillus agricola]NHN30470.1 response regulator transcription factor [Paenibacillus agricola]